MRYVLADLDLAQPLPSLELPEDGGGAGVLVRLNDRPVAFFITALQPRRLNPDAVRELVWKNAWINISLELLRRELPPRDVVGQFPRVTVAICTRDHPAMVERAIHSLIVSAQAAAIEGGQFEILVVDNAP